MKNPATLYCHYKNNTETLCHYKNNTEVNDYIGVVTPNLKIYCYHHDNIKVIMKFVITIGIRTNLTIFNFDLVLIVIYNFYKNSMTF